MTIRDGCDDENGNAKTPSPSSQNRDHNPCCDGINIAALSYRALNLLQQIRLAKLWQHLGKHRLCICTALVRAVCPKTQLNKK